MVNLPKKAGGETITSEIQKINSEVEAPVESMLDTQRARHAETMAWLHSLGLNSHQIRLYRLDCRDQMTKDAWKVMLNEAIRFNNQEGKGKL